MAETYSEPEFVPGHHEAEICYGGEADLHKHYTDCKKNPGHVNFIPVNDFNLDHLPSQYRDVIMLELIKALSALTVLIKVKYTSLERPKSVPCFSGLCRTMDIQTCEESFDHHQVQVHVHNVYMSWLQWSDCLHGGI
ncbi:uncharacterized protein LOC131927914 isoform X2 [Physella acuta]|uniref:uncharacterized protein LOC131927914 isoform X2 n=1 Tax=Physella acuta TaxID=109671 RepID=UPI0027DC87C0|nr:uncharacterized protein LOC131927914 isoform X2 [Physella acuta]